MTTNHLDAADFSAFHREVHGYAPFPWQQRLADRLVNGAGWPDALDLPTGAGKTTALDIAVFALAVDAIRDPSERTHARRIVLVVDRRVIVDQTADRANKLVTALETADPGTMCHRVATALASLSHEGVPLVAATLRGAMRRDDGWARSPDQPVVAASTVDQVGSRLLFRGYGVGARSAPIHAGLLGHDTLYLLDEVHLSKPFAETLSALVDRYAAWAEQPLGSPARVVALSATRGTDDGDAFGLDDDDIAHPVLARRLAASKPTRCVVTSSGTDVAVATTAVKEARRLGQSHRLIGVVVNRVAVARETAARLRARGGEVVLITGRMRPVDRDVLLSKWGSTIRTGSRPRSLDQPVYVVATQCIEAGADLDFDAMVTECASYDALVQRAGRVDRLGEATEQGHPGEIVVIGRKTAIAAKADDDPIYGAALRATWEWLESRATSDVGFDFGPDRLPDHVPSTLLPPRPSAPVLLPAHLDLLCQTGPRPAIEPEVAPLLHGPDRGSDDVRIVWRADLDDALLEHDPVEAIERVAACPPTTPEALAVPRWAARQWLFESGVDAGDVADVESTPATAGARRRLDPVRVAVAWRGDESIVVESPRDVAPGDVLVVPSTRGGLTDANWSAVGDEPVGDVGERCLLAVRGRLVLRLHPRIAPGAPRPVADPEVTDADVLCPWLEARAEAPDTDAAMAGAIRQLVVDLSQNRRVTVAIREERDGPSWYTLVSHRRFGGGDDFDTTSGSAFVAREIELDPHLARVAATVHGFATRCNLPGALVDDLTLAARCHDLGKADPRFQAWLLGGDEVRLALQRAPLAKSGMPWQDARGRQRARVAAGYPRGARHELLSTALMAVPDGPIEAANDRDLVLHLVASHHGWCRPFAPAVPDPNPVEVTVDIDGHTMTASTDHGLARLDSGVTDRFWRLVRRYGWHGLAWLEAILRLADHRVSESESRGDTQ